MHIVRGGQPSDYDNLVKLMHTTWPGEITTQYLQDPYFDWGQFRLVESDGDIVSMIKIYKREIRWGESTAIMGGIGDVNTHPDHRGRGYAGMLMEDSVTYMWSQGYDISVLFSGLAGFYGKYGWGVYPLPRLSIRPGPANDSTRYDVRRFCRSRDLGPIMRMYEEFNSGRTGTLVRTPDYWDKQFLWVREDLEAFLVALDGSDIVAYVRCAQEGDSFCVMECCYQENHRESVCALLLDVLAYAGSKGLQEVLAFVPLDGFIPEAAAEIGAGVEQGEWTSMMLNPIRPTALAEKLGMEAGTVGPDLMSRVPDFFFWRTDAF
jgi:GNAT superfamily N-acetyltransferase